MTNEISSVADLLEFLGGGGIQSQVAAYTFEDGAPPLPRGISKHRYVFRGISDEQYKLAAPIWRRLDAQEIDGKATTETLIELRKVRESRLLSDFRRESEVYRPDISNLLDLDQMFVAQHHGIPTRLLDWTENPLVALYFAAMPNDGANGSMWGLDPEWPAQLSWADSKHAPVHDRVPLEFQDWARNLFERRWTFADSGYTQPSDEQSSHADSFLKSTIEDPRGFGGIIPVRPRHLSNRIVSRERLFPDMESMCTALAERHVPELA